MSNNNSNNAKVVSNKIHKVHINDALIDEIQQKSNLPIVDSEETNNEFLEFAEINQKDLKPPKTKRDIKKEKEENKNRL